MSHRIGIRELKNQASSIVRRVREEAVEFVITHHGRPVAILRPIRAEDKKEMQRKQSQEALQHLFDLGATLTESNPSAQSAVGLLVEIREEENRWPS